MKLSFAVGFYNVTLADIVERHAPKKSRVATVRADKPWYTADLSGEIGLRRKCERKIQKHQIGIRYVTVEGQRNKYDNFLNSTKKDYIKNRIENAQSSKDLYKISKEYRKTYSTHHCFMT